jgi:hypothetical protein
MLEANSFHSFSDFCTLGYHCVHYVDVQHQYSERRDAKEPHKFQQIQINLPLFNSNMLMGIKVWIGWIGHL